MKLKTSILSGLMALAVVFSLTAAREAKADPSLGFIYKTVMSDGDMQVSADGLKRSCKLYDEGGRLIGSATLDFSNPDVTVLKLHTAVGDLVVEDPAGTDAGAVTADGNFLLKAGELTDITRATGIFRNVTGVIHRCLYAIDDSGMPVKCINCLFALIWD